MSYSVDVRIPREYKSLIHDVLDYLGSESPSNSTLEYGLLNALVSSPSVSSDVLNPYALFTGFFLTRTFVQLEIINRLEFIFSPTSLFDFLTKLSVTNSLHRSLEYRVVFNWKMDYLNRSMTRAESRNRMFAYFNNGGLDDIKIRWQQYCKDVAEISTSRIVDSLEESDVKRLGKCDWV